MKWIDPIVDDVRTTRENIWKVCGYNLARVCEMLRDASRCFEMAKERIVQ